MSTETSPLKTRTHSYLDPQTTHKKGHHPIILGQSPVFWGSFAGHSCPLWTVLWMERILHHLRNHGKHSLLVFTGHHQKPGFLGGANWISSIHSICWELRDSLCQVLATVSGPLACCASGTIPSCRTGVGAAQAPIPTTPCVVLQSSCSGMDDGWFSVPINSRIMSLACKLCQTNSMPICASPQVKGGL